MTLSKWQRRIVIGLAAVVAIFTTVQFLDGNIEGTQWLLPALVVGGLLFVAVAPSTPKPDEMTPVLAPTPGTQEDRTEVLWARVTSLGDRIFAASRPLDVEGFPAELRPLAQYNQAFARITALCCAYSTIWFKPRRSPPMVPSFDAFLRFRRRTLAELTLLISEADQLQDRSDIIRKVPNRPTASESAEQMLQAADDRRMRAETEMSFVIPAGPIVEGRTDLTPEKRREIWTEIAQLMYRDVEEAVVIPSVINNQKMRAFLDAAWKAKSKS